MKRFYTSLMVLAIALFGVVANAQHKVEISSAPHDNWVSGGKNFDPTEIATALGTDTATLHGLIQNDNIVYRLDGEEKSNTYTGNHNEWWMSLDGTPQGYGDQGTSWFVGVSYDEAALDETLEKDMISVYVGQMAGFFKKIYEPSTLNCTVLLVVGDKEVSFDVTQTVEAGVPSSLTAPVKELSKLTIVKDYTLEMNFVPGKQYEGKTFTAALDGLYEALGVEQADLDANINDHVLTQLVNAETVGDAEVYSLSDNLETPDAAAGGAWFGRYVNFDEATEEETPLPISCPKEWSGGCTFYTQNITLANGEFSIVSGQYPETMVDGDTDYTYLYITVGDKAARVKVQAIVKKPEAVDPSELVKVGETTVETSANIDNNYVTKGFSIDMEAVVAALGCTTDDLEDFFAYDKEGVISDEHTESIGSPTAGYFYNSEGKIESWGSNAAAYIQRTATSLQDGKFTIGQMPNAYFSQITEPTTITIPVIFQYSANYYVVNVVYTVSPKTTPDTPVEYTLVAREPIYKEMVPSADTWEYPSRTILDLDYIESKIGTQDFKLFADKAQAGAEGEPATLVWDDTYTCDPKPGFWYGDVTYQNEEGQNVVENAGWGSNSFGVTYADGQLTWFQYPGQRSVGDSYLGNLYLVNEETGAYIQYLLNVTYVETETPLSEDLGTESDTIVVKPAEIVEGVYTYTLDNSAIAEKLGAEAETLAENVAVYAFKTPLTRQSIGFEESFFGDEEGYALSEEDGDKAVFTGYVYVGEAGALTIDVDVMDLTFEAKNEDKAVIRLAFEANGKRITKVIVLVSEDSPVVGISEAKAPEGRAEGIFSLGGAALPNAMGGISVITVDGVTKKVLNK